MRCAKVWQGAGVSSRRSFSCVRTRSGRPVRRTDVRFSHNFSALIGILLRQRSGVRKENKVLLALSDGNLSRCRPHGQAAELSASRECVNSMFVDFVLLEQTVPANSMRPVSISASMQPAAHMSMALV